LTGLQSLILFHTSIGDAGLLHLKKMSRLRSLSVENTKTTEVGLFELREALPKLVINR
jgi:hypothetical protein